MNYTLVFAFSGPWFDADGRLCHLVSLDADGEVRRSVLPDIVADGDHAPVAHFNLSPSVEQCCSATARA